MKTKIKYKLHNHSIIPSEEKVPNTFGQKPNKISTFCGNAVKLLYYEQITGLLLFFNGVNNNKV